MQFGLLQDLQKFKHLMMACTNKVATTKNENAVCGHHDLGINAQVGAMSGAGIFCGFDSSITID